MTYTSSIIPQPPRSQQYLIYFFQSWEAARNPMAPHFPALNTINSHEKMCTSVSDVSPKIPPLTEPHWHMAKSVNLPSTPVAPPWHDGQQDAVGNEQVWNSKLRVFFFFFSSSGLDHGLDTDYLCDLGQVTEDLQTLQVSDSSSGTGSYLPHWVSRGWNALWRLVQM